MTIGLRISFWARIRALPGLANRVKRRLLFIARARLSGSSGVSATSFQGFQSLPRKGNAKSAQQGTDGHGHRSGVQHGEALRPPHGARQSARAASSTMSKCDASASVYPHLAFAGV